MAELLPLGRELVVDPETHRTLCARCKAPAMWVEYEPAMPERKGQLDRKLVDPDTQRDHRCNPEP